MYKSPTLLFVLFMFLGVTCNAQCYREQFVKLLGENDIERQYTILKSWEDAEPDDPELYVSFFNYYFAKSRQETVSLTTKQPDGESIPITKENDKTVVGYLGSNIFHTKADFDAGISYIDRGIAKFPDRLDMRFGKTYAFSQIGDFSRLTKEIVATIERSNANQNNWLWTQEKTLENPREFMFRAIQDYVVKLFTLGKDKAIFIMLIAETVLKYYPDQIESLSNLSVFYF